MKKIKKNKKIWIVARIVGFYIFCMTLLILGFKQSGYLDSILVPIIKMVIVFLGGGVIIFVLDKLMSELWEEKE